VRLDDRISLAIAACFGAGAALHLAALAAPSLTGTSSPGRHLAFVGVNALFAALFALRRRWTIALALPLVVQQAASHGREFVDERAAGRFDVQSALVFVFLPVVLGVAIRLATRSFSPAEPAPARPSRPA
jgi:hypothetical protein